MKYTLAGIAVAKKYAQAFLRSFSSAITFDDIKKIAVAHKFLQNHHNTLFFLQLPQFSQTVRSSMVDDLITHFSLPQECSTIFLLLIDHNRSFLIPDVLFFILFLYKKQHNQVDFSVKSSHALTAKQESDIKQFLDKKTDKESVCTYIIDKKLIAGIRMQSDEYIWEYSIHKQLQRLRSLEVGVTP